MSDAATEEDSSAYFFAAERLSSLSPKPCDVFAVDVTVDVTLDLDLDATVMCPATPSAAAKHRPPSIDVSALQGEDGSVTIPDVSRDLSGSASYERRNVPLSPALNLIEEADLIMSSVIQGNTRKYKYLGTDVAVKTLLVSDDDGHDRNRLIADATNLGRFKHPKCVYFMGVTLSGSTCGLVTEFMPGGSLSRQLRPAGEEDREDEGEARLNLVSVLRILKDIALALVFLHKQDVVHGRLTPSCILLAEGGRSAKLTGFGISLLLDKPPSPLYSSPEVLNGDSPVWQSDVYSLGRILFRAIHCRTQRCGDLLKWDADVPEAIVALGTACMGDTAASRPTSQNAADVFAQTLDVLAGDA